MDAYFIGLNANWVLISGELCEQNHPCLAHLVSSSKYEILISHNNLFLTVQKLPR